MIYVPDLDSSKCYEQLDTVIIRKWETTNLNQENNYTDYNTSNHYMSKKGSSLLQTAPSCIYNEDLTSDFYYRNDLSHIFIIFLVLVLFIVYLPYKIISRFYGRAR